MANPRYSHDAVVSLVKNPDEEPLRESVKRYESANPIRRFLAAFNIFDHGLYVDYVVAQEFLARRGKESGLASA